MTKAERTRQFIIEQSAPLFNTKGVAGTAMSDIMEATKMAKGGLYGHFESKEELSHAVVDYCLKTAVQKQAAALNKHKSAKAKLFALLDFYADPLKPAITGGCPMVNFGMEADDTCSVIRGKIKDSMELSENTIANIINDAITAGEFNPDVNVPELAIKIFAMLEGGAVISRVSNNSSQMRTIVKILKADIESHLT